MNKLEAPKSYFWRDINCEDLVTWAAPQNVINDFTDRHREMYLLNSYLGAFLFLQAVSVQELQMQTASDRQKHTHLQWFSSQG